MGLVPIDLHFFARHFGEVRAVVAGTGVVAGFDDLFARRAEKLQHGGSVVMLRRVGDRMDGFFGSGESGLRHCWIGNLRIGGKQSERQSHNGSRRQR